MTASNATAGYLSEENENANLKCTSMFTAALFTTGKIWA